MSKTMFAYETIKNTNFASDYGSLEQQLMPIVVNQVSDDELVDAIKGLWDDLQAKRHMTKERFALFVYDVNDINYLLYDGKNKKLKLLENELSAIVDNM